MTPKTTSYIVEFTDPGWRAWYQGDDGALQPVRFADWVADRSDDLISDDPMGLMQLAHAILADALDDERSFLDLFRDAAGQGVLRTFFVEELLPIKDSRPQRRRQVHREEVVQWGHRLPGTAEAAP